MRRTLAGVRSATALACALIFSLLAAGDALAKRLAGFDLETGVGFVLDGQTLTTTITPGSHMTETRRQLQGQTIRAGCASTYGEFKPVSRVLAWPAGLDQLAFTFDRDVSEKASWCLLERADGGRDITDAGFEPPPGLFFAVTAYRNEVVPRGVRRYLRIRDARGRIVTTRRGPLIPRRLLRPGRYTLISFERRCIRGCRELGPARLRCARRFLARAGRGVAGLVHVDQQRRRCRISFKGDR